MSAVTVFTAGDNGYAQIRIPALCRTLSGTLLAFAEGRKEVPPDVPNDSGDIDIILRRSFDGGLTWGPIQVALSHGADTAGNPTVVVDPASGAVILASCRNSVGASWTGIATGDDAPRRVYVQRSLNDGATWPGATEVTAAVRQSNWRWYATGPGAGVVLTTGPNAGRIVIPANHTRGPSGSDTGAENKYAGAHLIYSDNGGVTWALGATSSNPNGEVNEGEQALTVLADGRTLYGSVRCEGSQTVAGTRADAISTNGGVSYSPVFRPQCTITTPVCEGALLTLPDGRLLYSGPSLPDRRAAMAIWLSDDNGRTWNIAHRISGLPAAYSALAMVDSDTVGLLYETGDWTTYRRIEFEPISTGVFPL